VAVVNDHMANHYWKGDAVGKRFHLDNVHGPLVEVVGIARMAKYLWIAEPPLDFFYLPYRQYPHRARAAEMSVIAESVAPDAATLAPVLREVVRKLDPDMPVFDMRTMQDIYTQRAIKTSDVITQVVAGMGMMGMILSAVGLYGLMADSVSRQTPKRPPDGAGGGPSGGGLDGAGAGAAAGLGRCLGWIGGGFLRLPYRHCGRVSIRVAAR